MSRVLSTVLILAVVAVISVGSAYAADEDAKKKGPGERKRPSAEQIFKKLDTDKDGKITADELVKSPRLKGDEAKAKEIIAKMDTNKDGGVCAKEFAAAIKKHMEGRKPGERRKRGEGKKPEKKDDK